MQKQIVTYHITKNIFFEKTFSMNIIGVVKEKKLCDHFIKNIISQGPIFGFVKKMSPKAAVFRSFKFSDTNYPKYI
jgi:hypothetical protein